MKMYKFNIGDRVKVIVAQVDGQVGGYGVHMPESVGKIFTVLDCYDRVGVYGSYRLQEDFQKYVWDERCLRRVRKAVVVDAPIAAPMGDFKPIKPPVAPVAIIKAPEPLPAPVEPSLLSEVRRRTGNKPHVCSYGLEKEDGSYSIHTQDVCHARLATYEHKQVVKVALDIQGHAYELAKKGLGDKYLRYVNYIINYSPWSPIFHTRGAEHALKHGILLNVEKPIHQVLAAAVVLREGSEFSKKLHMFCRLLDEGHSGNTAYLLSAAVSWDDDDYTFKYAGLTNAHKVLSGEQDKDKLFQFFRTGYTPKDKDVPYRTYNYKIDGVARHIAPFEVFEKQINSHMSKMLVVGDQGGWLANYTISPKKLSAFAHDLDGLLNK